MLNQRIVLDRSDAPLVALTSESLARRRFAAESPIGQRLRIGPMDGPPYTIVGVVGDVRVPPGR